MSEKTEKSIASVSERRKDLISGSCLNTNYLESLILAQDERWRRA